MLITIDAKSNCCDNVRCFVIHTDTGTGTGEEVKDLDNIFKFEVNKGKIILGFMKKY